MLFEQTDSDKFQVCFKLYSVQSSAVQYNMVLARKSVIAISTGWWFTKSLQPKPRRHQRPPRFQFPKAIDIFL